MRQLNELGLLELVRETPRRGAIEHHYRAKPRPKSGGDSWDSVSAIAKQAVIGAELAQTTEVASRAAGVGGFDSDHARLERLRLSLTPRALSSSPRPSAKLVERGAQDPGSRGQAPRHGSGSASDTALVAMLFDAIGAPDPSAGRPEPTQKPRKPRRRTA